MRGPGGITRRGFASLAAGTLAACLCGCDAGSPEDHGGKWFIIGSRGEPVGTARFSDADEYGFAPNGLAAVQDAETELWGFVDKSGRWVVGPTFLRAREFAPNGLAAAQDAETGLWGFVDETGSWTIGPRYSDAWMFYDNGTADALDESGHDIVWLDEEGNELEGGRSPRPQAREDPATGLWGIIASDGTWALEPAFADLVVAFDANVLAAKDPETGLWGYISWDGGWVVQPAFSDATRMGDNGHALARMP